MVRPRPLKRTLPRGGAGIVPRRRLLSVLVRRVWEFAVVFTGFSCTRCQDGRPAFWRRWFGSMLSPGRMYRPVLCARLEALEGRCLLSAALPDAAPSDIADKIDARFYESFVNVSRGASDDWVRGRKVRADSA